MILFLDFDGVLHPEIMADAVPDAARKANDFSHLPFFEAVMREFTQIDIVISSAWRETHSLHALRNFFSPDIACRVVGVTPVLPGSPEGRREREIRAWLREAQRDGEPMVAVDDWPSHFSPGCAFLFCVNPDTALDAAAADMLRQRLAMLALRAG